MGAASSTESESSSAFTSVNPHSSSSSPPLDLSSILASIVDRDLSSDPRGWKILHLLPHSPASHLNLISYFDCITHFNGKRILEAAELKPIVRENELLHLTLFSLSTFTFRTISVLPNRSWAGSSSGGLLGLMIHFDSFFSFDSDCIHVLDVYPSSPAAMAGLQSNTDYLLGTSKIPFSGWEQLDYWLESNEGVTTIIMVYNCELHTVREVKITPNSKWGGKGALGCDLGVGLMHRLPLYKHVDLAKDEIKLKPITMITPSEIRLGRRAEYGLKKKGSTIEMNLVIEVPNNTSSMNRAVDDDVIVMSISLPSEIPAAVPISRSAFALPSFVAPAASLSTHTDPHSHDNHSHSHSNSDSNHSHAHAPSSGSSSSSHPHNQNSHSHSHATPSSSSSHSHVGGGYHGHSHASISDHHGHSHAGGDHGHSHAAAPAPQSQFQPRWAATAPASQPPQPNPLPVSTAQSQAQPQPQAQPQSQSQPSNSSQTSRYLTQAQPFSPPAVPQQSHSTQSLGQLASQQRTSQPSQQQQQQQSFQPPLAHLSQSQNPQFQPPTSVAAPVKFSPVPVPRPLPLPSVSPLQASQVLSPNSLQQQQQQQQQHQQQQYPPQQQQFQQHAHSQGPNNNHGHSHGPNDAHGHSH